MVIYNLIESLENSAFVVQIYNICTTLDSSRKSVGVPLVGKWFMGFCVLVGTQFIYFNFLTLSAFHTGFKHCFCESYFSLHSILWVVVSPALTLMHWWVPPAPLHSLYILTGTTPPPGQHEQHEICKDLGSLTFGLAKSLFSSITLFQSVIVQNSKILVVLCFWQKLTSNMKDKTWKTKPTNNNRYKSAKLM